MKPNGIDLIISMIAYLVRVFQLLVFNLIETVWNRFQLDGSMQLLCENHLELKFIGIYIKCCLQNRKNQK